MLISLITNLINFIVQVFITLMQFLLVVVLGLVAAVLLALPWLMRGAAFAVWLVAAYMGISSIQKIYAPFSEAIPLLSLQFALILAAVAWVVGLTIRNSKHVWGGFFVVGLVIGGCAMGANWLSVHWVYEDLAFRTLPPALFSILLTYETLHQGAKKRQLADNSTDTDDIIETATNIEGGDALPATS